MSDDLIPPVPPAERVFKVGSRPPGDKVIGGPPETSFPGRFLTGIQALWGRKRGSGEKISQPLFASAVQAQGMDLIKQFFVSGINLDVINKILAVVLAVVMVSCLMIAIDKKSSIGKLMQTISRIRFEQTASSQVEVYQPLDFYLGQVRQRDIFNPPEEVRKQVVQEPLPPPPPEPPKPQLKEMAGGLSVVGVAWGETPKAMIKDDKAQETYFLKKGQKIGETGIEIKDIRRDKVILGFQEEEIEL